jgi:site-specific DNA recombinase
MERTMKTAAIYARVSLDKQKEEHTIASQTAGLIAFAQSNGYSVPPEWVFEDEGYSGASLVRPGLEKIRDLAAEGQIEAVLIHSPDRLSRKYAYQVLLIEEFSKSGVEAVFLKAPQAETAEDRLLLQFQGMIAEYERAQILERSRRGKRHKAKQGNVSILSGAPYGYRYVRKTDQAAAYYEIAEAEAQVVRQVYERYTVQGQSIGEITRQLNELGTPTRLGGKRWERSTVWAILRNPAYRGAACYGKTQLAKRQRITRPLRQRGGISTRESANHERPKEEWIEIPVPAIVSDETFALAAERLESNKRHAPRRTVVPSVVQGLVSCRKCGYAMYRTSTHSSARKIYYYRCLGSDAWRHLNHALCDTHPVRMDLLDAVVWDEIVRLLEDPSLIQAEINRRLETARQSSPAKRREEALQRELVRLRKGIERLLTAYQEDLLSLDELRSRMPDLRQRERAAQAELLSLTSQESQKATYLRLAETVSSFFARLKETAHTLDAAGRNKIVRLLVKDILVGDDSIVIRHSIPVTPAPSADPVQPPEAGSNEQPGQCYALRSGRHDAALGRACHWRPAFHAAHDVLLESAFEKPGTRPSPIRTLRARCEINAPSGLSFCPSAALRTNKNPAPSNAFILHRALTLSISRSCSMLSKDTITHYPSP